MRVFVASASEAVSRTLHTILALSGHEPANTPDAELTLLDNRHPITDELPSCPRLVLQDALASPFRPHQLIRLLQGYKGQQTLPLCDGWQIDLLARTMTRDGQPPVGLTEKETALLGALAQAQPNSIHRDALLAEVWGVRADVDTHTLETHIYRLRAKLNALAPVPCDILTSDGAYKIVGMQG